MQRIAIRRAALLSCLTLYPLAALAQQPTDAPSLPLDVAIRTALKRHPSLERVQAQVGAARARIVEAGSGMRPILTVQGAVSDGPLGAPTFGPLNNPALNGVPPLGIQGLTGDPIKKQYGASLNMQQPLLDFGRTQHLTASRRDLVSAAEQDAEAQQALVILNVQEAYLGVLRQQALADVQRENLRQREETLRQAKALVSNDLKPGIDLESAQADTADARVGLIAAENETRLAFATLNNAMGETRLQSYRLDVPPPSAPSTIPQAATLDALISLAQTQRPEMLGVARQLSASDQAIKSLGSEKMPRLDGIASVGAVNPSRAIPANKNYGVAAVLTIPLYVAGMVEGRTAEERKKRDALVAQQRETGEAIHLQVTRAWLNLQTREAQQQAADAQVKAAQESLRLASERYRLQLSSVVELTDAEAAATRARNALINAQYDRETARAELDWAVGSTYRRYAAPAETEAGKVAP